MENNNWNTQEPEDIIQDIKKFHEIMKKQTSKKITLREAIYHDNNILSLAGYPKGQIEHYDKLVLG